MFSIILSESELCRNLSLNIALIEDAGAMTTEAVASI